MYAWIWRKLPFGLWGKFGGSLMLVGGVVALLWYVVFPWAEPILPFDDVQVGDPGGGYEDVDDPVFPSATPTDDPHDIPYETREPSPTPSKRR